MNENLEPLSKHEKLMQSIRSYSTPLRKAISNSGMLLLNIKKKNNTKIDK